MESPSVSAADARASETSAGVSESPLHVTSLHVTGSAALRMGWRCPSGSGTVVSALWTDRPVPGEAQRPLVLGLSAEAPAAWSTFTFDCSKILLSSGQFYLLSCRSQQKTPT